MLTITFSENRIQITFLPGTYSLIAFHLLAKKIGIANAIKSKYVAIALQWIGANSLNEFFMVSLSRVSTCRPIESEAMANPMMYSRINVHPTINA